MSKIVTNLLRIIFISSFLFLLVIKSPAFLDATPPVRCVPHFEASQGWLGADAGYSIPLTAGGDVWLFGDTFVATPSQRVRSGSAIVSNTIGISSCKDGKWSIQYYWGNQEGKDRDRYQAFFESHTDQYRFWPLDGFVHEGRLYVGLVMVARKPGDDSQFGFLLAGVKLAVVENPQEAPNRWRYHYMDFVSDGVGMPGASIVKMESYAYFFTSLEKYRPGSMALLRVPLNELGQPSESMEYLNRAGIWKKGLDWTDVQMVMEKGSSEMTVRYHAKLRRWIAVYPGNGFPTKEIVMRTAPKPDGPWSMERKIFEFPEMNSHRPAYDKETFCSAAKEHPQYEDPKSNRLLLTYACNSSNFEKQIENMRIYFPIVVTVNLP